MPGGWRGRIFTQDAVKEVRSEELHSQRREKRKERKGKKQRERKTKEGERYWDRRRMRSCGVDGDESWGDVRGVEVRRGGPQLRQRAPPARQAAGMAWRSSVTGQSDSVW